MGSHCGADTCMFAGGRAGLAWFVVVVVAALVAVVISAEIDTAVDVVGRIDCYFHPYEPMLNPAWPRFPEESHSVCPKRKRTGPELSPCVLAPSQLL